MTTTTGPKLITPAGTVVSLAAPHTAEWYAARRTGIGSSDIPAILGYSPYRSAGHVWAEKRGAIDGDDAGEAALWGTLLEPVIATEWAARHDTTVAEMPTIRQTGHPHRLASLDRRVITCPDRAGQCGLEIKAHSEWKAGSWREDVPDAVLAQVSWQLLVSGLDHIHVAALIGGQRLVEHTVHPDATVMDYVAAEADRLWQHVLDGICPHVDNTALLLDLLDRLNPDREGQVELDADRVLDIHLLYRAGAEMEKAGAEAKDEAKAALVLLLGSADTATVNGTPVATYKATLRANADLERLAAEFPGAYTACITKKPTRPGLRWKDRAVAALTNDLNGADI